MAALGDWPWLGLSPDTLAAAAARTVAASRLEARYAVPAPTGYAPRAQAAAIAVTSAQLPINRSTINSGVTNPLCLTPAIAALRSAAADAHAECLSPRAARFYCTSPDPPANQTYKKLKQKQTSGKYYSIIQTLDTLWLSLVPLGPGVLCPFTGCPRQARGLGV